MFGGKRTRRDYWTKKRFSLKKKPQLELGRETWGRIFKKDQEYKKKDCMTLEG